MHIRTSSLSLALWLVLTVCLGALAQVPVEPPLQPDPTAVWLARGAEAMKDKQLDQAYSCFQKGVATWKADGKRSLSGIEVLLDLADLCLARQDLDGARAFFKESIDESRRIFGADTATVIPTLLELHQLELKEHNYNLCRVYLNEAYRLAVAALPDDCAGQCDVISHMIQLHYTYLHNYPEVESLTKRFIALKGSLPDWRNNSNRPHLITDLGRSIWQQGRHAEGKRVALEGYGEALRVLGHCNHQAHSSLGQIIEYLLFDKETARAEKMVGEHHQGILDALVSNSEKVESLNATAATYNANHWYGWALSEAQTAHRLALEEYGNDAPESAATLEQMARAYGGLERFAEQEAALTAALAVRAKLQDTISKPVMSDLEDLMRLYRGGLADKGQARVYEKQLAAVLIARHVRGLDRETEVEKPGPHKEPKPLL